MSDMNNLSAKELEAQANAILAAADEAEGKKPKKGGKKAAAPAAEEPPRMMTDEEAKKAGILRLTDKQVAALPAASWLINNERLRELLAKGKKEGKLDKLDESEEIMFGLPRPEQNHM